MARLPSVHVPEHVPVQRPDVQIGVVGLQVDLQDPARGRHVFELGKQWGILRAEVVAQHRCSRGEVRPAPGEHPPARRWDSGRKLRPEVLAETHRAGEQSGQGGDLFRRRLPAFQSLGGDGLGQGVAPGLGRRGYHVENVEVDAR